MTASRIPVATYRIQLGKDFRFLDARDIVPYLHSLGISDLYTSPRYRPRRGSSHGYDVADPMRINSEIGADEEFDDLCERLKHYAMGLLEDIVPNHMAASGDNPWWMDVLENGPSSPYSHYFDIDWHPSTSKAAFLQDNRVLIPVLGDLYGAILEDGGFSMRIDDCGFHVRYGEARFPLDPKTYGPILDRCAGRLSENPGDAHPAVHQMRELQDAVARLPARTVTSPDEIRERFQSAAAICNPPECQPVGLFLENLMQEIEAAGLLVHALELPQRGINRRQLTIAGQPGVGGFDGVEALRLDKHVVQGVEEVIAGGAAGLPVLGKRLVSSQDLLHHHVEVLPGGALETSQVAKGIVEPIDVIDAQAGNLALLDALQDGLVPELEDVLFLDPEADEIVDVEKAAVIDLFGTSRSCGSSLPAR